MSKHDTRNQLNKTQRKYGGDLIQKCFGGMPPSKEAPNGVGCGKECPIPAD